MESSTEDRCKEEYADEDLELLENRPSMASQRRTANQKRMARLLNTKFSSTIKVPLDYEDSPTLGGWTKIPTRKIT